ncbi:hypothetical protein LBYZC6_18590 [Lacrimispora brassicae]
MDMDLDFKARARALVSQMTLAEKTAQLKYDAPAIPRLGVPAYNWWNECLHGVARAGAATVFPQPIGMAAAFHEDRLYEVAQAISDEARAKYNEYRKMGETEVYQGLTFWSPNINIFRDPRWGRGHETYGEDPLLTGVLGTAFIKGLQGDGVHRKLDATIKHYAVHSGPEAERHSFDARVDEKELYETYLWAFRYCIEHADPSAVMGAYNRVNGEPCCASETLLMDILYGEFGFDGYVVSDCGAICDINRNHGVTNNEAESAALALNNGCQLNCGDAYRWLLTAVSSGLVGEETVTEAAERLFTARFRLGMFDDCEYDKIPYSVVECEEHQALNRKMAQESIVLLKNDGILPLKDIKLIAVIGPNSDDKSVLLGNYHGTPANYTTFLKGIQDHTEAAVYYAKGCHISKDKVNDWEEHPLAEAVLAARRSDVVIMFMGLNPSMEGEEGDAFNGDRGGDKKDIELPKSQQQLLDAIVKCGKPVIFVNVSGSCINLSEPDQNCAAVIQCFYPGAEGGNALADILFGDVSPSARLPVTFYRTLEDVPAFEDYSMKNRTYRFYEGRPLYPFGYGLTYSEIQEEWLDSNTVKVMNCGNYDTWYSVLQFENEERRKLIGFRKVWLEKGTEQIILMS